MKISMNLSRKSIQAAAKALADYAKHLKDCETAITERLSEIAAEEAAEHFDEDVTVTSTANGVLATGPSVVFQEFGACAAVRDPLPGGADVSFEIRRGAYSDLHYGEYAQSGYKSWHHNGTEYTEVVPNHGLFYGMMKAKEEAPRIAKEVLEGS